ncbi:hypothetical protein Q9189_005816 [Teloschistes chrysophthalmus]
MAGFQFIKHLWLGSQHYAKIAFRALGLNIVVCWFRSFLSKEIKRKSRIERPKVAIRKHRPAAFLRALVHVLPVTAALFLVAINFYQYYVGSSIQSLVLYQFIAKVFEIMAQASLAAIVFSYIRHEMVQGQGIPLGALFSGLQLSQASYLWSMEFWGSVRSNHLSLKRKCGLVAIMVSAISLAAVVGPSSAILLIPRLAYWPGGSTHIWINITSDALWPINTKDVIVPPDCSVVKQFADTSLCPSDEWQSIEKLLQLKLHSLPQRFVEEFGYSGPSEGVEITSKDATRSIWAHTVADVNTGGHGVPLEQLNAVHRIEGDYYQPYTIGSCANDTIKGVNDERPLAFPVPPGVSPDYVPLQTLDNSLLEYPAFPLFNVTRAEILDTAGPSWENRLLWIELPQDPFNGSAIGALALLPVQDPRVQKIVVCTLGAGWGQSTLNTSTRLLGSSSVQSAELIAVTKKWASYLNPFVTELNTTVFHQLMQNNLTLRDPAVSAAIILPGLLSNGLSRIGIESSLQGDLRTSTDASGKTVPDSIAWFRGKGDAFIVDPDESKDWVKFKVDTTFEGYVYISSGVGAKVAIVFLLIYCAFAIAHTCYAGISAPTKLLRNTSSGITEANIFKLPARIFAKPDDEGEGEHLELVLGEQDEKTLEQRTLKMNRVSG